MVTIAAAIVTAETTMRKSMRLMPRERDMTARTPAE